MTDTSRSGDLVKRLGDNFDLTECEHGFRLYGGHTCQNEDCDRRDIRDARDCIEALEAENERLRGALKRIQHFSPAYMWRSSDIQEIARAALGEKQ